MIQSPFTRLHRRWKVIHRFLKLPPLQRASLLRRRLPWFAARPTDLAELRPPAKTDSSGEKRAARFALTCVPHPTTGFGHRFTEWISGLIVARAAGLTYLSAGLGEGWDEALGFSGAYRDTAVELRRRASPLIRLPAVPYGPGALTELLRRVETVMAATDSGLIMLADGQAVHALHPAAEELRGLYARAKKPDFPSRDGAPRVVVHVRRGDVAAMRQLGTGDWARRFVELDWFESVLRAVVLGIAPLPCAVEIVSQGKPEDFVRLTNITKATLHLNEDAIVSFHRMATADVLICSPSSYSFNAGLCGEGLKLARSPWWHEIPVAEDWLLVGDGEVDVHDIASAVRRRLAATVL